MPLTGPTGIHCVLYAFFDRGGGLDREAMRRQAREVLAMGVDGIFVLGLATEVHKLSFDERCRVIDWAAEDIGGACPLTVTVAGDTVADQVRLLRVAEAAGAAAAVLQPPARAALGERRLVDIFAEVISATPLTCGIQNAPGFLDLSLSGREVAELADRCPGLAFVKAEGSAVDLAAMRSETPGRLRLLGGRGGLEMTDCLRAGADGFVLAPDAVDHACDVFDLWRAGDADGAEAAHAAVLPALVFMMQSIDHLLCYGKRIFARRVGLEVHDRAPFQAPTRAGLGFASRWADHLGAVRGRDPRIGPGRTREAAR